MPGFSIARCMFPQGRLVLEKGEELVVLREGDRLPGPEGFRVLEISRSRAVLARSAVGIPAAEGSAVATVLVPETLILIELGPEGTTAVTVGTARAVQEPLPPVDDGQALITLSPEGSQPVTPGELRSLEPPSAPQHRIGETGSSGPGSGDGGGR
ncbi:MAG: hypothetical protein MI919_08245 [Holophagales bacterium]|nr:hypothetical protein [Holophagales bacterium]